MIGSLNKINPFQVVVRVDVPAGADFANATPFVEGRQIISGGADMVVTHAYVVGFNPADLGATIAGLGPTPTESPDGWSALCMVSDEESGKRLSSEPVNVLSMFGTAQRPCRWPAPWVVKGGSEIVVSVSQYQDIAQTAYFVFCGYRRPSRPADLPLQSPDVDDRLRALARDKNATAVDPFWYAFNFDGPNRPVKKNETKTIAVSGFDFAALNLYAGFADPSDGSAWFVLDTLITEQYQSRPGADPLLRVSENTARLSLNDGRVRLNDRAVPVATMFGTGRRPGRFPYPLLIEHGETLTMNVLFTDGSAAANTPVRGLLAIGGARVS